MFGCPTTPESNGRGATERSRQKILSWGGCDERVDCQNTSNAGFVFNTESNHLVPTTLVDVPLSRAEYSITLYNEKALIWGGIHFENGEPRLLDDGALFNFETKTWEKLPRTGYRPQPRYNATLVTVENVDTTTGHVTAKAYLVGGCNRIEPDYRIGIEACYPNEDIDAAVFDFESKTWSQLPIHSHFLSSGIALQTVVYDEKIFYWPNFLPPGDEVNPAQYGIIYDTRSKQWSTTPRFVGDFTNDMRIVWTGSEVALVGGWRIFDLQRRLNESVFYFNPNAPQGKSPWAQVHHPELPAFLGNFNAIWTGQDIVMLGFGYDKLDDNVSMPIKFMTYFLNPNR